MFLDGNVAFQRPSLALAPIAGNGEQGGAVKSLPELIRYNVEHNPQHPFCLQAEPRRGREQNGQGGQVKDGASSSYEIRTLTMEQLGAAVECCVEWLQTVIPPMTNANTNGNTNGNTNANANTNGNTNANTNGNTNANAEGNAEGNANGYHHAKHLGGTVPPVALFLESNVGLFIYIAALLEMGIPVLILSARLSSESINHLLSETGSRLILLSARTQATLDQDISKSVTPALVETYPSLIQNGSGAKIRQGKQNEEKGQRRAAPLILHSSGTTGLPKPIAVSPRYPLIYAACHEFPDDDSPASWANMSTLPLYHGFGLLAPCLSLAVGLTCCFPPASIIPSAVSTVDLLAAFQANSLMTVPSIMDEVLDLSDDELGRLASLKFVAVGGGALDPRVGEHLVERHGVALLNHYGVTEIGAIAPIFCPGPDYDWRYLRIRNDIGLRLVERRDEGDDIDNKQTQSDRAQDLEKRYKLIGLPIDTDQEFEIQDDMETRPGSHRVEVRLLGRRDDLIVLKTGEKVLARVLEQTIVAEEPAVKTAVCLGQGCFEVMVLVEPSSTGLKPDEVADRVWAIVQKVNPSLDRHARISSRAAIIVLDDGQQGGGQNNKKKKAIPRSDKGSVMRAATHTVFREEMDEALSRLELEGGDDSSSSFDFVEELDRKGDLEGSLASIIELLTPQQKEGNNSLGSRRRFVLGPEDDFFERGGMDSMWATRLARQVNAAVRRSCSRAKTPTPAPINPPFIYQHPTTRQLAWAIGQQLRTSSIVGSNGKNKTQNRVSSPSSSSRDHSHETMRSLLEEYAPVRNKASPEKKTVLMTGSTGNLGSHLLYRLAQDPSVDRIVCLVRAPPRGHGGEAEKSEDISPFLAARQASGLADAGLKLSETEWSKLTLLPQFQGSSSSSSHWLRLVDAWVSSITHIVHLAWPMDFHRLLPSFRPHLDMVRDLVGLARDAHRRRQRLRKEEGEDGSPVWRTRILFTSSIAVVRHYGDRAEGTGEVLIPEKPLSDPGTVTPMGYAEAKWVCEHMLSRAAKDHASEIEALVVRVGQLSGPEGGNGGVWKTGEHIPALVRASQALGKLPKLEGTMSWLPVDRAAKCLQEMLVFSFDPPSDYYGRKVPLVERSQHHSKNVVVHLENPVRVASSDVMCLLGDALGLTTSLPPGESLFLPYEEWLAGVTTTSTAATKAGGMEEHGGVGSLAEFFRYHFRSLGTGAVVLDTKRGRSMSPTLRGASGVGMELLAGYVARWRETGFLV